jgi:hypothetical protein
MKKLTVWVVVLLLVGCGEIMHGPKDTMTQEHSLTMSELNVATNILAAHGHSDMIAIRGLSTWKKTDYVYYYQIDLYCTKQGASGLYRARITAHNPQDQEGWWSSMQVDSVTTQ